MEEGGAKIFGVFRVKNHDFTPKNDIFSNFRGGARRVSLPLDPPLQLSVLFICNAGFAETKFDTFSIHITQAQMSF